ncbi:MAG: hypothetical protein AAGG01_10690 [Planctomycetota bacterium]
MAEHGPKSSAAASGGAIEADLDAIAERASEELRSAYARREFMRILRAALPLVALVPFFYLATQLARWNSGGDPKLVSVFAVGAVALLLPLAFAWLGGREARRKAILRGSAIGEVDQQLGLEGRLRAADDFVQRPLPTPFELAAIEDAGERTAAARAASLAPETAAFAWDRAATIWAAVGAAGLLAILLVEGLGLRERIWPAPVDDQLAAAASVDAGAETEDDAETKAAPRAQEPRSAEEPPPERRASVAEPEAAEAAPDAANSVKESAGKTGTGRSSGALSSSAGSESRSAPSSQAQKSEPAPRKESAKKREPKKRPVEEAPPQPEERPEEEESGATAGRGSSKGSNRNPTASEWRSRDQVTESDEQEVEDDDETEDDEENQENRGGVQPSLRDRRPPVSRDLQISFGNRSNPDANGRGGPSQQKKSRGVASLVLGVPIPDRIKGRPGKGPTKITQERIEPQAEEATPVQSGQRTPRSQPTGSLPSLELEPSLTDLVRRYFLARRAASPPAER